MLCGTVGFLEAAADAPAKSTQSESDQQTLRCSRWWWKILMLILIMAMVTVVTPPPPLPMHALKKVFYLILQHSGWGMVGPASRRANAWLVSSSRLSPTARCRCLFFCKADFSNAMPTWPIWYFGLFLWVNDNTVLCRSYGRLKLNFLCKRFSPCIYSFCSIDLIYMKPNTSDSPYM